MGLTVKHHFSCAIPDDAAALAAGQITPQTAWNHDHDITGTVGLADIDQTVAYAFSGLGATTATTLALGGATIGSSKLAMTGNAVISGTLTGMTGLTMSSGNINLGGGDQFHWGNTSRFGTGNVDGQFQLQNNAQTINTYFYIPSSGVFSLGQAPSASPLAQALRAQDSRPGTDSNVGGATITYQSGQGTGTGTESHQTFKTPIKVGSGSGAQTMLTALDLFEGVPAIPSYAFANLPTIPGAGMLAYVTDSTTNVWGATIAGSGANPVLAWYNGANWTVLGK